MNCSHRCGSSPANHQLSHEQATSPTDTIKLIPPSTMTMSSSARMLAFDDFAEALAAAFSSYRASATSDFRASLSHLYISDSIRDINVGSVARVDDLEAAHWNDFIDSFKTDMRSPSLHVPSFYDHYLYKDHPSIQIIPRDECHCHSHRNVQNSNVTISRRIKFGVRTISRPFYFSGDASDLCRRHSHAL